MDNFIKKLFRRHFHLHTPFALSLAFPLASIISLTKSDSKTTDLLLKSCHLRIPLITCPCHASSHATSSPAHRMTAICVLPRDFALRLSNAAVLLPYDFELCSLSAGPSPLPLRLCTPLIECRCHTSHAASHSANRMLAIYPLPLPPQFSRPAHQMPLSFSFPCDLFISPIQCYCQAPRIMEKLFPPLKV